MTAGKEGPRVTFGSIVPFLRHSGAISRPSAGVDFAFEGDAVYNEMPLGPRVIWKSTLPVCIDLT